MDLRAETVAGAFGADRAKAQAVGGRFTLEQATTRAQFEEGYALLQLEFGPLGEIEREEVLTAWFDQGSLSPPDAPIQAQYHLVLARDEQGTIAGVRDVYVTTNRASNRVVVLLSHSFVLPSYRRSGLASLLRGVPVPLAHAALPGAEVMLAAEMELVRPQNRESVVRLLAYGRAGFQAIPPDTLAYAQPDFRELARIEDARPIPFVAVVRRVGAENETTIPRELAWAFVAHFQAAQGCHCDARQMAVVRAHAARAFALHPGDPTPLLRLPRHASDLAVIRPLLRSTAYPLYPEIWWGPEPVRDPDDDLEALSLAWSDTAPPKV